MIYILTGAPGAGKTLSALEWMERIKVEEPGRMIYAANIDGLCMPGVLPLDDEGVLSWHRTCEKNSIIFVDEAQRYWRAQRSGEPSDAIIEMETHRHDGIDIVLMTQHPTFLHANIRKLANEHVHLVGFSKSSALRFQWRECHDDVQDDKLRNTKDFKEWKYPARLYQFYKSATLHTKRAKRPLKMVIARYTLAVLGVLAVAAFGFVGYRLYSGGKAFSAASASKPLSPQAGHGSSLRPSRARDSSSPLTAEQFADMQRPRIPTQPYSAPIYDGQAVTQHPRIWCIAMVPPGDCRCITEQGTRYILADRDCRALASGGAPYDPYLPSSRDDHQQAQAGQAVAVASPPVDAIPVPSGQGARMSWSAGVGSQDYTPPAAPGSWNSDPFSTAH